jgi:hypothetical protein
VKDAESNRSKHKTRRPHCGLDGRRTHAADTEDAGE